MRRCCFTHRHPSLDCRIFLRKRKFYLDKTKTHLAIDSKTLFMIFSIKCNKLSINYTVIGCILMANDGVFQKPGLYWANGSPNVYRNKLPTIWLVMKLCMCIIQYYFTGFRSSPIVPLVDCELE